MKKPELLLPVGHTEAFYAALEGGADAVYLGLRSFNARNKAANFAPNQLQSILKEAEKTKLKVYLTLNTLIKNRELPTLLDTLFMLSQTSLSAVIIQDPGVLYLLHKFFPKLKYHASTQMGFHNSCGTEFAHEHNFERIILARELTRQELQNIAAESRVQLEVFVHGALCYSFSGMCLFSSYLGGMSANRGLCRQPCRRIFNSNDQNNYFFSLKDNQLIRLLPELMKMNISSIKIEGRMKSAEYVYQTARAYRMAIDDPARIEEAEKLLSLDLGRAKTAYFAGGNIGNSITENPFSGKEIGSISKISKPHISIRSSYPLSKTNRIRIQPADGSDSKALKLKNHSLQKDTTDDHLYHIKLEKHPFKEGDLVFLAGLGEYKFKNKFALEGKKLKLKMPYARKQNILARIGSAKELKYPQLFIRIDNPGWLRKIYFDKFDFLILKFSRQDLSKFDLRNNFLRRNRRKMMIELPKFIAENDQDFYQNIIDKFIRIGISHFMLGHISQKKLFHPKQPVNLSSSENVYCLNDAAIQFLHEEKIKHHIYPLENDHQNLLAGKDRKGIVPLYFYPELFYSRMPVKLDDRSEFKADKNTYKKVVKDGITIVIPKLPVSLLQYHNKLSREGFQRFLIDFSYQKISQNTFNRLLKKFNNSQAEQPSTPFNFKKDLF